MVATETPILDSIAKDASKQLQQRGAEILVRYYPRRIPNELDARLLTIFLGFAFERLKPQNDVTRRALLIELGAKKNYSWTELRSRLLRTSNTEIREKLKSHIPNYDQFMRDLIDAHVHGRDSNVQVPTIGEWE